MLTIMTFNAWLFISVILGSFTGYYFSNYIYLRQKLKATSSQYSRKRKEDNRNGSNDLEERIQMLSEARKVQGKNH